MPVCGVQAGVRLSGVNCTVVVRLLVMPFNSLQHRVYLLGSVGAEDASEVPQTALQRVAVLWHCKKEADFTGRILQAERTK